MARRCKLRAWTDTLREHYGGDLLCSHLTSIYYYGLSWWIPYKNADGLPLLRSIDKAVSGGSGVETSLEIGVKS